MLRTLRIVFWLGLFPLVAAPCLRGQTILLRQAPVVELPPVIDGNSAAFWADGRMSLFHSTGEPSISRGEDQFSLNRSQSVQFSSSAHRPVWFEAVWRDDDGTLFLWYHHEAKGVCPGNALTSPKIGAAISWDNGATVQDLGIVLESGDPDDCSAKNGFFAGGHGDLSVVLDRNREYFYIFFTNYGGPLAAQGVATARMAFRDRFSPIGNVFKYHAGNWTEPGLGGDLTPVFPAVREWAREDADSFWGPSIHWNKELEQFVILMNHACCEPGWPQEGIYVSLNADLGHPEKWRKPKRLMEKNEIPWSPGYYPQVLGMEEGETDHETGAVARLYVHGRSAWEIYFDKNDPASDRLPDPPPPDPCGLAGLACPVSPDATRAPLRAPLR